MTIVSLCSVRIYASIAIFFQKIVMITTRSFANASESDSVIIPSKLAMIKIPSKLLVKITSLRSVMIQIPKTQNVVINRIIESSAFPILILAVLLVTLLVLLGFAEPISKMISDNAGVISRLFYS